MLNTATFAAVKILNDKIRVDFSLSRQVKSRRFKQHLQMSAHRYLYVAEIAAAAEIDEEPVDWIQEAHDLKTEQVMHR